MAKAKKTKDKETATFSTGSFMKTESKFAAFFDKKKQMQIIDKVNKALGVEKMTSGNDTRLEFRSLPTCLPYLNYRLNGGFKRRKIHLSYGEKSVGKSFFDYKNIAVLQRLCRNCLGVLPIEEDRLTDQLRYFFAYHDCGCKNPESHRCARLDLESDYEFKSNPEETDVFKEKESHMLSVGVVPDLLSISFAASLEDCVDIMKEWMDADFYDYISIDSLQGTQSDTVFGKEGNEDTMGIDPRKNNILLRNIIHAFHSKGIDQFQKQPAIHIISQVRFKIGQISFTDQTGGEGLKHQNSLTLQWKREKFLSETSAELLSSKDSNVYGLRGAYHSHKSKISEPYFSGKFDFFFKDTATGFFHGDVDYLSDLVSIGQEKGTIQMNGNAHYIIGNQQFHGKAEMLKALRADGELVKVLLGKAA